MCRLTLANHPRVPEKIRNEVSKWGTCKDEFMDGLGDGWQTQFYGRMEPVFFALGQVAGTAASIAVSHDVAVQDVPYVELATRLTADGQVFSAK